MRVEAQPDHQEEGRAGAETERYCRRLLVDGVGGILWVPRRRISLV